MIPVMKLEDVPDVKIHLDMLEQQGKICAICEANDEYLVGDYISVNYRPKKLVGVVCRSCAIRIGRYHKEVKLGLPAKVKAYYDRTRK